MNDKQNVSESAIMKGKSFLKLVLRVKQTQTMSDYDNLPKSLN